MRSIVFQQNGANGGARAYDMYVRVPDNGTTAIETLRGQGAGVAYKRLQDGRIIVVKNGQSYNLQGQAVQ